jgi:hypothetical protein
MATPPCSLDQNTEPIQPRTSTGGIRRLSLPPGERTGRNPFEYLKKQQLNKTDQVPLADKLAEDVEMVKKPQQNNLIEVLMEAELSVKPIINSTEQTLRSGGNPATEAILRAVRLQESHKKITPDGGGEVQTTPNVFRGIRKLSVSAPAGRTGRNPFEIKNPNVENPDGINNTAASSSNSGIRKLTAPPRLSAGGGRLLSWADFKAPPTVKRMDPLIDIDSEATPKKRKQPLMGEDRKKRTKKVDIPQSQSIASEAVPPPSKCSGGIRKLQRHPAPSRISMVDLEEATVDKKQPPIKLPTIFLPIEEQLKLKRLEEIAKEVVLKGIDPILDFNHYGLVQREERYLYV